LKIKNEGTKKINSIVWEFTDPHFKGDKEIVFTEVKTKLNLAAGETGVLSKRVSSHWPCLTHIDERNNSNRSRVLADVEIQKQQNPIQRKRELCR
jgi:hypothetical protein